jgi:large subunit ribosomal protein L35
MPKMKTKRSAAKRFSFTKRGKVKMKRSKLRHILTSKTRKQKRRLRKGQLAAASDMAKLRRLLPYG